MAEAADSLTESLKTDGAARLLHPFDDLQRTNWAYFPRESVGDRHAGLSLQELNPAQRKRVLHLVATGLSFHAFGQVAAIMALESVLDLTERYSRGEYRDPAQFWVAVFGIPGSRGAWSWRFEGHHVSVHHTIVDGLVVASTPLFLGASPAEVRHGNHPVLRPCGEEEDAARTLLASLDADQRARAVLHPRAPLDIVVTNRSQVPASAIPGNPVNPFADIQAVLESMEDAHRQALRLDLARPAGVAASAMSSDQRRLLEQLVNLYVERLPVPLADVERDRLDAAGLDRIHFAWAGSERPRRPHYYRLQGPSMLVEYDCTQDDANHIHSVWRDPDRDFGRDLLKVHLSNAH
jgi:hypothetical protein